MKSEFPKNLFEIKFEKIIKDTVKIYNDLSIFLKLKNDKNLDNKIQDSKFIINSSFNIDRTSRFIDKSTIDRSKYLEDKEKEIITQNITSIDTSFLEKETFELDIKTKNELRKKKLLYLSDILVNVFYDLKIKSILKSQLLLIIYTIKKFLSKFIN